MKPTVGRIVHYTASCAPPEVRAAIITKVTPRLDNGEVQSMRSEPAPDHESHYVVSLHVFSETGAAWLRNVPFSDAEAGSPEACECWTWPKREGP